MSVITLIHMPSNPVIVGLLSLILLSLMYLIGSAFYNAFIHPLSKVPGPKLYAITQMPYLYHLGKGDWHDLLKNLHNEYGPVVRYTPNDVSFISGDSIKKIHGHKSGGEMTFEKDPVFYRDNDPVVGIINAPNEDHRRMRRLLSHAFSEKALRGQEDLMHKYVQLFIDRLGEQAKKGQVVDIVQWYNFATFDLIGDLAFGQPFGCLEEGSYHPWVRLIFESVKILPFLQISKRLGFESVAELLAPPSLKRSLVEHKELSRATAMRRLETKDTKREDFMSYILRHNDHTGMSVPEIVHNSATLVVAGSETTATLLSGTTYHLLMNPEIYTKLTREIRNAFQSEEEITLLRANQLEYLGAVLNEGLRMYPPVPTNLPRLTPASGEIIDGYWIPGNTSVSTPQWSINRSKHNFLNPETFVPERWLDDPAYDDDNKSAMQPFSFGPRNCIGRNLAYAEMRLILTRLLYRFDLKIMDDSKNWDQQGVFVLWEKNDLHVQLEELH